MTLELVNPPALGRGKGYSHGVIAPPGCRLLFIAGQIGWDAQMQLAAGDLVTQFDRALANVLTVVREAGGGPEHVARLTLFVTDRNAYLNHLGELGRTYRAHLGKHYPAMALVEVKALLHPQALVEIQGIAALPPDERATSGA
jgi:enamine deaminase RidA (YjgF/YER057c/UK114 family)